MYLSGEWTFSDTQIFVKNSMHKLFWKVIEALFMATTFGAFIRQVLAGCLEHWKYESKYQNVTASLPSLALNNQIHLTTQEIALSQFRHLIYSNKYKSFAWLLGIMKALQSSPYITCQADR